MRGLQFCHLRISQFLTYSGIYYFISGNVGILTLQLTILSMVIIHRSIMFSIIALLLLSTLDLKQNIELSKHGADLR